MEGTCGLGTAAELVPVPALAPALTLGAAALAPPALAADAPGPAASEAGRRERGGGELSSGRGGRTSSRCFGEEEGEREDGGKRCCPLGDVCGGRGDVWVDRGGDAVPALGYRYGWTGRASLSLGLSFDARRARGAGALA